MKKMKKIFALLIAMVMVLGMSTSVFAASITVNQDSTYSGTEGQAGRTFTYKQIFHATLTGANKSTGGGYDTDGTPGTVSASLQKGYSYFLNSTETTQIGQLGTWDATNKTWTKATGNLWFDLTPSADGSQYIVSWAAGVATDTDTAQAAAKWLSTNYTALASNNLTWNSSSKNWTATGLEDGYYLLSSDTGDNLIAATGDIQVNEKNSYPPVEKTQADEDNTVQTDQDKNVAVGDVLTYEVKVTIPATAKVGETIAVYDAPSAGLSYNNDMAVKVDDTSVTPAAGTQVAPATAQAGEAWRYTITVDANNKNKVVLFQFTMTVTAAALTDTDKLNPAGLVYNNYNSKPDEVKFKTYYTGIEKVDGEDNTKKLADVEFTLKEAGVEFPVTKSGDYYVPVTLTKNDGESDADFAARKLAAATVKTDANGLIIIRGLDNDKAYTLTETKTQDGYNLLVGDKTLTLIEDGYTEAGQATYDPTTQFDKVENNKGTVLPSTGGMGTTIFYIIGAILVIGAGVVLVTRRRMNK